MTDRPEPTRVEEIETLLAQECSWRTVYIGYEQSQATISRNEIKHMARIIDAYLTAKLAEMHEIELAKDDLIAKLRPDVERQRIRAERAERKLAEAERERNAYRYARDEFQQEFEADKWFKQYAHAEQENAALRERVAGLVSVLESIRDAEKATTYPSYIELIDGALTTPLSANPDTAAERPHVRDTGQGAGQDAGQGAPKYCPNCPECGTDEGGPFAPK